LANKRIGADYGSWSDLDARQNNRPSTDVAGGVYDHATDSRGVKEFVHLCVMGEDKAFLAKAAVVPN